MALTPAPLHTDILPGPAEGAAYWAQTSDGLRIRIGVWAPQGARGTVLIFPGRTEYIEKYGIVAAELAARGLASVAVDWRGQGLADRLLEDPLTGHVAQFSDYQKDMGAMMRGVRSLNLPRPYFLLAHSMGGAIGLRAVMEDLGVQAAAFSGPMWGIHIPAHKRFAAHLLSTLMPKISQGHRLPQGTTRTPYPLIAPFEDNMLTTDAAMYDMMRAQITAHPELQLGGPSYVWLREALAETQHLADRSAPNMPCITLVGTHERIVDLPRIHARMAGWKGGTLRMIAGAEHEVLMETPEIRTPVYDAIAGLFLNTGTS